MGLEEPVVPPFPISDYGTGCMGAIAALAGLYRRGASGGSWHGKTSLLHHDLLLYRAGLLPPEVQEQLRSHAGPDFLALRQFLALRHCHSVDQISGTALGSLRRRYPDLVDNPQYLDPWYLNNYKAKVSVVLPVVEIQGLDVSFARASRPNGANEANWHFDEKHDHMIRAQTTERENTTGSKLFGYFLRHRTPRDGKTPSPGSRGEYEIDADSALVCVRPCTSLVKFPARKKYTNTKEEARIPYQFM